MRKFFAVGLAFAMVAFPAVVIGVAAAFVPGATPKVLAVFAYGMGAMHAAAIRKMLGSK